MHLTIDVLSLPDILLPPRQLSALTSLGATGNLGPARRHWLGQSPGRAKGQRVKHSVQRCRSNIAANRVLEAAAGTAHIPNAGEHLVRYYGWYSNMKRGKRRKTQAEDRLSVSTGTIEACSEVSDGAAKRAWARLTKQVYEVDPLVHPRCGSAMRITVFIEQPAVIETIRTHLSLCSALSQSKGPTLAHSPPLASGHPLPCSLQRVLAA